MSWVLDKGTDLGKLEVLTDVMVDVSELQGVNLLSREENCCGAHGTGERGEFHQKSYFGFNLLQSSPQLMLS